MKNIKKLLALLLAGSMMVFSACSDSGETQGDSSDNSSQENGTSAPEETGEETSPKETLAYDGSNDGTTMTGAAPEGEMTVEEQRELMINNSLLTTGDTTRLKKVFEKAESGEEITVGYIGGSITEGIGAPNTSDCYANLSYLALCDLFPDTTVNYVNAGLSGTPSILGLVRAERDLFSDKTPDIIFIEFAVNDGGEELYKECYENLVLKCLNKENQPAVVLLFTVLKNGYTCQENMSEVGKHYNLPMISVGNAINPMISNGYFEWEQYSDDESHPNGWGHELVKDFILNLYNKVLEDEEPSGEIAPLPDGAPVYSNEYVNMELLERDQMTVTNVEGFSETDSVIATFKNGWRYRAKSGASITFTQEFKTLFLVFHCNNAETFADADIYVDGELVNTISSNRSGGWGNPEADVVCSFDECGEHTVEVRIAATEGNQYFGLAGIGVVK